MFHQPQNDLRVFCGAQLQTTTTSGDLHPFVFYNRELKANILTALLYFRKYNKCQWDPWWSPSRVSAVYSRAQHTWFSSSIWARDCFWQDWDRCVDPHWNKVFHEMPNLVHRECDEGIVGCPQWKAIQAEAVLWNFWFLSLGISTNLHFRQLDVADDISVCPTYTEIEETAVLTQKMWAGSVVKDFSFGIIYYSFISTITVVLESRFFGFEGCCLLLFWYHCKFNIITNQLFNDIRQNLIFCFTQFWIIAEAQYIWLSSARP